MMPNLLKWLLIPLVWLVTFVSPADSEEKMQYTTTTKKPDDKVTIEQIEDKSIFQIQSPSGIGQLVIKRNEDRWNDIIVVRLRLKGLESLRVFNGKTTLEAAVSSHDEIDRLRLWKGKSEDALIKNGAPLWMDILMDGSDGKSANSIPLNDGYFEFKVPKPFLEDNPKSISVHWIDFYRQHSPAKALSRNTFTG